MFRLTRLFLMIVLCFFLTGLSAKPPVGIDMVPEKNRIAIKAERPITKKGFETAKQNREDQNEEIALNEERLPLVRSSSVGRPSGESIDYTQRESSYVCPEPTQVSQPYQPQAVYEPCCTPKRAWIIPAVAAAGGIGAGVAAATSRDRDDPSPNGPDPVQNLTFDFLLEEQIGEGDPFINFDVVLPNGTVFESLSLNFGGDTVSSGPIPNVFSGETITIVATNYDTLSVDSPIDFTMTGLIDGVQFDEQVFEFQSNTNPPPPQEFEFIIP